MAAWIQDVTVGSWFQIGGGPPFEVVAVDLRSETVEIQHFDGTIAEVAFDVWVKLRATPAAEPEDYRGAMDMPRDDDSDAGPLGRQWLSPSDRLDLLHL